MIRAIDVPWWARPVLGAALGALIGVIATVIGRNASRDWVLTAVIPLVAAANVAFADLGRRRFSPVATAGAAVAALVVFGCFRDLATPAALDSILLGGFLGVRLVGPGKFRQTRRGLLFVAGAAACPLAILGAWKIVHRLVHGEPLGMGLALAHALFWLPVAGAEAALAWSAERAVSPRPRL